MGSRRLAGENVPAGTLALVRSPLALRCSKEQSALHTLIRQRHLTPSCGGHAPTAERTMDPARIFTESLTPRPELENAIMRRARPYRGENHGPGKDFHRELDPTPGIREQPGSTTSLQGKSMEVRSS